MYAKCLNGRSIIEVSPADDVISLVNDAMNFNCKFYKKASNNTVMMIFEPVKEGLEKIIPEGLTYCYYKINGELYKVTFTNSYQYFKKEYCGKLVTEANRQLKLIL